MEFIFCIPFYVVNEILLRLILQTGQTNSSIRFRRNNVGHFRSFILMIDIKAYWKNSVKVIIPANLLSAGNVGNIY